MIRTLLRSLALGALVASAGGALAQERVVNVYNWSDYIDQALIQQFTQETGIRVVYDVFDSNEILETKLLAGGSGYDVVVPTGSFLSRQIQAGVFQPLDKAKLPNISNMWNVISERTAAFDPGNEYSINYMWGTTGIGYNKAKVQAALGTDTIDSWSAVLDPANMEKLNGCGVYFLDSPTDVIPSVLLYLGLDPNSSNPEDIAKAQEALLKVRPFIRKFHSSELINALANGDICVAVGYSGDIFQARDRAAEAGQGVEIGYSVPKEGAQMWFDQMAIPADAPHPAEALEFINFMMKPDVIAKASNFVFYANGNAASKELLDPAVRDDPAIYPPDDVVAKLFIYLTPDPRTQRVLTRAWTAVVTGQ